MSFFLESSRASLGPNVSQQRQTYSFPLLRGQEILTCLHDMNIPINQQELTKPENHVDSVRRLFEQLVEHCLGITREEMSQPVFSGLNCLNYPQLHENSIPELALLRQCTRMMGICGVRNFTIKDLTHPTSKRLRRQLSAAINFCKFREERLMVYDELVKAKQGVVEGLARSKAENAELQRLLAELREKTAEEGEQIDKLEGESQELENEIGKLNRKQASLTQESKALKQQSNSLKDKLLELDVQIQETQNQRENFRSQIVSSPARIRREMANTSQALEAERQEGNAVEKNARSMQAVVDCAEKADVEIQKILLFLEEVEKETKKYQTVTQEVKHAKEKIAANKNKIVETQVEYSNEERTARRLDEKLKNLRQTATNKSENALQMMQELQKELMKVEKSRRETMLKAESSEADILRLTQQLSNVKSKNEAEINEMIQTFKRIESAVVQHHRSILATIKESNCPEKAQMPLYGAPGTSVLF